MNQFSSSIDCLNEKISRFSGWLCMILVFLTVEQVVARYLLNSPSNALEELKHHLFGSIFLLAGAYTLKKDEHVRVDIFYQNFSEKKKALINMTGLFFFLIPSCILVILYGFNFTAMAYNIPNPRPDDYYTIAITGGKTTNFLYSTLSSIEGVLRSFILRGEVSGNQGGLDAKWIVKAMIPISFLLYFFQCLSLLIKNINILLNRSPNK